MPSWPCAAPISTAGSRPTGRSAALPNRHFYVAHPLVAQTIVSRRLRWQATENDGPPHLLHCRQFAPLASLGFGYAAVRHVTVVRVDTLAEAGVAGAGALQPVVRQVQQVWEGGVGERQCRGVR